MKFLIFLTCYALITSITLAKILQEMPAPRRTASPALTLLESNK